MILLFGGACEKERLETHHVLPPSGNNTPCAARGVKQDAGRGLMHTAVSYNTAVARAVIVALEQSLTSLTYRPSLTYKPREVEPSTLALPSTPLLCYHVTTESRRSAVNEHGFSGTAGTMDRGPYIPH